MSIRTVLIGLLAIVAGTAAAAVVRQMSVQLRDGPERKTVPVVIAKADIPRSETVEASQLTIKHWPEELVPEGVIHDVEAAANRATLLPQVKGQPISEASLAPPGVRGGLAAVVPEGMRAFTIHIPTMSAAVAGFVVPGNKVDVLLTVDDRASCDSYTKFLLQNVEILAVDQELDAPADNKTDVQRTSSVTLVVTPPQASKRCLAQEQGVLHMALRNPEDEANAEVDEISLAELRYGQELPACDQPQDTPPAPVVTVASRPPVVRVRALRGRHGGHAYFETPYRAAEGATLAAAP